jgi:hypothetical protein
MQQETFNVHDQCAFACINIAKIKGADSRQSVIRMPRENILACIFDSATKIPYPDGACVRKKLGNCSNSSGGVQRTIISTRHEHILASVGAGGGVNPI